MATPGKSIDQRTREQIERLRSQGVSVRETARRAMVSPPTVQKVTKK